MGANNPLNINQLYNPLALQSGQEVPMGPLQFPDNTAILKEILQKIKEISDKVTSLEQTVRSNHA